MNRTPQSPHRIELSNRVVGPGHPAFIVAEVAQAHDGSLGFAHAFVDAVADAGADAIKFQTHIAEAESTYDEAFRVAFSRQDATRFDYWQRMEFSAEQWEGLARHAAERGVIFMSSPFSEAAVDLLDRLGVPAWKVASGEVGSGPLLERMLATGKPVLLSTGMSTFDEIDRTVSGFREAGTPFAILQCTSVYPTPLTSVGLNVLDEFRSRYGCPVGLSDHSGTIWPGVAAMARGCDVLEVHITLDRRMFGPDVPASLTADEFVQLCQARDALAIMDANPVDKDEMAESLANMRELFFKSVAPARDLPAGVVLERDMLVLKKPGTGIAARELDGLVGRRLAKAVSARHVLRWEDIEGGSGP